jgi:hypothetical protein
MRRKNWWLTCLLVGLCCVGCARDGGGAREDGPSGGQAAKAKQISAPSPRDAMATRSAVQEACSRGCMESVKPAPGAEDTKRAYCDGNCACLVDARYDASGKQKTSTGEEVLAQVKACRVATVEKVKWSPD